MNQEEVYDIDILRERMLHARIRYLIALRRPQDMNQGEDLYTLRLNSIYARIRYLVALESWQVLCYYLQKLDKTSGINPIAMKLADGPILAQSTGKYATMLKKYIRKLWRKKLGLL